MFRAISFTTPQNMSINPDHPPSTSPLRYFFSPLNIRHGGWKENFGVYNSSSSQPHPQNRSCIVYNWIHQMIIPRTWRGAARSEPALDTVQSCSSSSEYASIPFACKQISCGPGLFCHVKVPKLWYNITPPPPKGITNPIISLRGGGTSPSSCH